jgi:hypothetical protein
VPATTLGDGHGLAKCPAYVAQLHADLERFVFLLGGSDGEPIFSPDR